MGLDRIEHVIVVMLENRSFDHMLGFLDHPKGSEFKGLRPNTFYNEDSTGARVYANPGAVPLGIDPDHSHAGAMTQLGSHGSVSMNGGFVINHEATTGSVEGGHAIMRCLDPAVHAPVLSTLAVQFAVCTAWYCSVPGATWPNRNFAHAGTSDGTVDIDFGFYRDRTVFEALEDVGETWSIYYDGPPQVWFYPALWKPRIIRDVLRRNDRPRIANWRKIGKLYTDIASGNLASYTFVEPAHNTLLSEPGEVRRTNSQHPHNNIGSSEDFRAGEDLIQRVYEALRKNSDLFEKTLLIITYDEHGGFYDHVRPPACEGPGDPIRQGMLRWLHRKVRWLRHRAKGGTTPYDFSQLGFRVPAVLVSPWISPHTIVTDQLEHASIPKTLSKVFGCSSLTKRDTSAGTFHQAVTDSPRVTARRTDDEHEPLPVIHEPERSRGEEESAGDVAGPVATSELDEELADLTASVDRTLRTSPAVRLLRRRAGKRDGDKPMREMKAPELFADTANRARA